MSTQAATITRLSGEYLVVSRRSGSGIDHYLEVVGPDGRTSEQRVYWLHTMTPADVAEAAVDGHLGVHHPLKHRRPTRQTGEGTFVVTVG
ncbi:hypothetical protein GCM10009584_31240 [Ornithinimicrobium humiphilum]|uniref:Uncharacterized protein n=1 Tax=Ornithinimicrobium humiphilum TaxID=125288 RepID=A0A543K5G2_9MICO|nr:hypothetical protein [Ornithinimicrobium humiphilum]TQM90311.1 hypothetical protein FB476_3264 [Ornithinimicrobium humiphilum]